MADPRAELDRNAVRIEALRALLGWLICADEPSAPLSGEREQVARLLLSGRDTSDIANALALPAAQLMAVLIDLAR